MSVGRAQALPEVGCVLPKAKIRSMIVEVRFLTVLPLVPELLTQLGEPTVARSTEA